MRMDAGDVYVYGARREKISLPAHRQPALPSNPSMRATMRSGSADNNRMMENRRIGRLGMLVAAALAAPIWPWGPLLERVKADQASVAASPKPSSLPPAVIREIGSVRAVGSAGVLQTNASVISSVAPQALQQENALRASDALKTLPGVNSTGVTSAVGDDSYIDIRGLKPSESQVLLDGHPIGPIGVSASSPDADGLVEGFNFQDSPAFALSGIDVTFGAGATGLYGGNTVGGTIDMRTLSPTARNEFTLDEGIGDEGRMLTALKATGTRGRLGYVLVDGAEGTYGAFPGSDVAQTGLRGTDFTSTTLQQLTYPVSGDYLLRNALGKVTYKFSPATNAWFTAYDATSWSDKTGNGDNDFNSPSYMLSNAPIGNNPSCPNGVWVQTNAGRQCISASQYAQDASGPAGGGPGAWQAFRSQDYHARLTTAAGNNSLMFDAFTDNYAFTYNRDASYIEGPTDAFLNRWATQGFLMSDDIATVRNQFGFGYYLQRQTLTGDQTVSDGSGLANESPASRMDNEYFVRDTFMPIEHLSLVLNAWEDKASIDPQAHLNPRLSLIYKPSPSDVLRVTSGRSVSEPSLQLGQVTLTPVGALNPDCGAVKNGTPSDPADVNVGSGPGSNLRPEKATDIEVSYGHRFTGDTAVGVSAYAMNMIDRIVTVSLPTGSLSESEMSSVLNRIETFCAETPTALQYTLSQAFNAATAQARGIEISGRVRADKHLYFDYSYDIQSLIVNDLPSTVLADDPTLVNGIQAFQVPLHKANLGIDFSTRSGFEGRLDGHFVGINNPQQLPGYAYADASLTQRVSKRLTLNLGISNVFNSHSNIYNMLGLGVPYPVNSENANLSEPFVQPFNTLYGLAPTSVMFNAELKL
jgi:outer membrane receptor protein involved in Fe transport